MSEYLQPNEDYLLRFTLDGVKYALENNIKDEQARLELRANLKFWFPDAELADDSDFDEEC